MGVPACQMFTWDMFGAGCAQGAWEWSGLGRGGGEGREKSSWQLGWIQSNLERVRLSAAPIPGGNMEIML